MMNVDKELAKSNTPVELYLTNANLRLQLTCKASNVLKNCYNIAIIGKCQIDKF